MVEAVIEIARRHGLPLMVRLVKGAYWDGEIKRAQENGPGRATRCSPASATPTCAIWPARSACWPPPTFYPQFATHNAGTIAAILEMARRPGASAPIRASSCSACTAWAKAFYREVIEARGRAAAAHLRAGGRAPRPAGLSGAPAAGERRQLLLRAPARRRGGVDPGAAGLAAARGRPVDAAAAAPALRRVARQRAGRRSGGRARAPAAAGPPGGADARGADRRQRRLGRAGDGRAAPRAARLERGALGRALRRAAPCRRRDGAPDDRAGSALLVQEGRKTFGDGVAEVREAIDFCRYYAEQAEARLAPQSLPGPTGEKNELRLHGRGVSSASARGTSRWRSSPARWWRRWWPATRWRPSRPSRPRVAPRRCVELLIEAGLPRGRDRAACRGAGETVGAALVADPRCAGRVLHRLDPGRQDHPAPARRWATARSCR